MRAIRSKNTKPEIFVRRIAHRLRPGYRLNHKDIPGKPDLAWIGRKHAVFVHGCFWHGHDCARGARVPKTNREYWMAKIARNRSRDTENIERLQSDGWRVLVIWECELKNEEQTENRMRSFLDA